ncbi:MAG: hypothetical protein Kow0022_18120 [Phycisphaerales bacterium]
MPIHPLPQFEEDLLTLEEERRAIEALRPPKSIVVRFGLMGMIGEFPYRGDATPGCGSKIVVRTHRGIEIGDMLTSTCPNSGCPTSVSREQMLAYIENSGGRQYPFFNNGRALRVATAEDLRRQQELDESRHELRKRVREIAAGIGFALKIVEVEPILSGDRLTVYFAGEERVDTRPLAQELASALRIRVDVRQVGARDEARLTADYERCGQYCCCKNFLKVLKPISMKAAKTQKATLDPLKISGRCGRLMCCLRYEEQTYEELRRNLPKRKTRVGTPEGDGIVIDTQILTQLVLVQLDSGTQAAFPVEHLTEPGLERPAPAEALTSGPGHAGRSGGRTRPPRRKSEAAPQEAVESETSPRRKRRRRRRKSRDETSPSAEPGAAEAADSSGAKAGPSEPSAGSGTEGCDDADRPRKKKRRRRRKPRPDASGPGEAGQGDGPA